MAGHYRAVLLVLTLSPLVLQKTTGQEVQPPRSSVDEIVEECTRRNVRSLCDPDGILTTEEEVEIRRSLEDIERTSFARNSRICASTGQRLNATVVVLPALPNPSTSSEDKDLVNTLIQALLPDRTICNLVAIFLLKTSKLYWTHATGSGSDVPHKIHGRTLKMATRNETQLDTIKLNLYDIVDATPEEPYYLARGVISFGKPAGGGGGGGLAPLGWGGDWTIMLYIGIGLISTITVLALIVCCLLYRRKKLLKKWEEAETDADSAAVMVNISERNNAQPKQQTP
ncbi:uncharacterized protein LOC144867365 isoform X1 [Branchiostoma floridae x Branchiostoma japonicum]